MRFDTVIRGGSLVLPGRGVLPGDIGIRAGKVAAVVEPGEPLQGGQEIDAAGLHVFPGVIGPHSHLGIGQGYDDFATETRSAALGGVTTILLFLRQPVPYEGLFREARAEGERRAWVDFSFHAVVLTRDHLESLHRYADELGITSFKFYMTYRGEDARMLGFDLKTHACEGVTDGFMYDVFASLARHPRALAIVHCENIELIQRLRAGLKAAGRDDMEAWQASRPPLAEVEAVRRALTFAEATGCRLNILHLTTAAALAEVRAFRRRYGRVHVEVCHPYLVCHAEDGVDKRLKMRPPLRTRADNEALWQGVRDGSVDTIGSDHVPRRLELKLGSVWDAVTGGPETPTLLPLLLSEGYHKRGVPLERIAELTSYNPARVYGLYPRKGDIRAGADADLTLVDLNLERAVRAAELGSHAGYSLYEGWTFRGWPVLTMVRGAVVMRDGHACGQPGWGRYIPR